MLEEVVLTFGPVDKILSSLEFENKNKSNRRAVLDFPVILLIMLYKMVLTLGSVKLKQNDEKKRNKKDSITKKKKKGKSFFTENYSVQRMPVSHHAMGDMNSQWGLHSGTPQ